MKYRVGYKVTCRCYVEVEADCIEDAMEIADGEMMEIDIGERAEDFEWEQTSAEQVRPLLAEVYGVDEFGNVLYKEGDE